jgi:tousled-like kinase
VRKHFNRTLISLAQQERLNEQTRISECAARLGTIQAGMLGAQTKFGSGTESDAIDAAMRAITKERKAVEKIKKEAGKLDDDAAFEARELANTRNAFLLREEQTLKKREQKLHSDRVMYRKQAKTFHSLEASRWRGFPCMGKHNQYQLLNMLGKGGFSEVWKAYDMEAHRYCAVKIHEVCKDETEEQRATYIRHALREYEIQKKIDHPRIVQLFDRFIIDQHAFGTVMTFSEGEDLDTYLKANGVLTEKEARGVMLQIFSGLKVLHTAEKPIIHYDLKPANLLIKRGEIQITDFGLSKIAPNRSDHHVELTSPGSGTYWYLPPESFAPGAGGSTRVSPKVDVWSAGIIFFEMLFGRRPFGHGMSQDSILRSGTILSAKEIDFPASPKVSDACKDFIRRLLTYSASDRPDVTEVLQDAYMRGNGKVGSKRSPTREDSGEVK